MKMKGNTSYLSSHACVQVFSARVCVQRGQHLGWKEGGGGCGHQEKETICE